MINSSLVIKAANLAHSFVGCFSALQTELNQQLTATEAELNQVKKLMDDAIDDIVDSFISLEATTRIGHHLIKQMVASETDTQDELNPFREKQTESSALLLQTSTALDTLVKEARDHQADCVELATLKQPVEAAHLLTKLQSRGNQLISMAKEVASKMHAIIDENTNNIALVAGEISTTTTQIEKDVQAAVKSMQFQDMTSQLIVQCIERQKIMQGILNTVNVICDADINSMADQDWQIKLAKLTETIRQASSVRMKIFNVDGGSVELF